MTRGLFKAALLTVAVGLVAGCASNATREAALLVIDQVDAYEKAVGSKIQAEQQYYSTFLADLRDSAERRARREELQEELNAITRLSDRAIVVDKGLQLSVLQDFLRDRNERAKNAEADRARRQAELRQRYSTNFETLTFNRRQLAKLRSQLLVLTREQQTRQQVVEFLRESASRAIELQQEEEQTE